MGHSGASGIATPKVRTKVKILADEERRDAIVRAFEVSLFPVSLLSSGKKASNQTNRRSARLLRIRYGQLPRVCYLGLTHKSHIAL